VTKEIARKIEGDVKRRKRKPLSNAELKRFLDKARPEPWGVDFSKRKRKFLRGKWEEKKKSLLGKAGDTRRVKDNFNSGGKWLGKRERLWRKSGRTSIVFPPAAPRQLISHKPRGELREKARKKKGRESKGFHKNHHLLEDKGNTLLRGSERNKRGVKKKEKAYRIARKTQMLSKKKGKMMKE